MENIMFIARTSLDHALNLLDNFGPGCTTTYTVTGRQHENSSEVRFRNVLAESGARQFLARHAVIDDSQRVTSASCMGWDGPTTCYPNNQKGN
jgi:hypothetical protein